MRNLLLPLPPPPPPPSSSRVRTNKQETKPSTNGKVPSQIEDSRVPHNVDKASIQAMSNGLKYTSTLDNPPIESKLQESNSQDNDGQQAPVLHNNQETIVEISQQPQPKKEHSNKQNYGQTSDHADKETIERENLPQHLVFEYEGPPFEIVIAQFYEALEETRSYIILNPLIKADCNQSEILNAIQQRMDTLFQATWALTLPSHYGINLPKTEDEIRQVMATDCLKKARQVALTCIAYVTGYPSSEKVPQHNDIVDDDFKSGPPFPIQAIIARLTECTLAMNRLHMPGQQPSLDQDAWIIQAYTHYQTQTLNQRAKPAVANLVTLRNVVTKKQQHAISFGQLLLQYAMEEVQNDNPDDDDEEATQEKRQQKVQPHMYAITTILNEATQLIHPLICWYEALPPEQQGSGVDKLCLQAIKTLDKTVVSLLEKLGKWFLSDREIKKWMEDYGAARSRLSPNHAVQQEDILDNIILEELSYLCQLLKRYSALVGPYTTEDNSKSVVTHPLELAVQEYIGYYSTLENSLYTLKLNRAIDMATVPVEIYDGIYVSSLVEDAYFLSKRTLERVVSTGNDQAIMTLTNRICESWGRNTSVNDEDLVGIHHAIECGYGCDFSALAERDQDRKRKETEDKARRENGKGADAFASAFLDALDDDMNNSKNTASAKTKVGRTPPVSGNSLLYSLAGSIVEDDPDLQLKSHICALNSVASAASACTAISVLYNDIIEAQKDTTKMLQEEWRIHGRVYSEMLHNKVLEELNYWVGEALSPFHSDLMPSSKPNSSSGINWLTSRSSAVQESNASRYPPLVRIQRYLCQQSYDINNETFYQVESDAVLVPKLLDPLHTCSLLNCIVWCEEKVVIEIIHTLTARLVNQVLLPMIFQGVGPSKMMKRFTEWGALLLAKQVRLLQNELCRFLISDPDVIISHHESGSISTAPILNAFEKVSQIVSILQLEKPSDWSVMRYSVSGVNNNSSLTPKEIKHVMLLRVGFSPEAVAKVCESL